MRGGRSELATVPIPVLVCQSGRLRPHGVAAPLERGGAVLRRDSLDSFPRIIDRDPVDFFGARRPFKLSMSALGRSEASRLKSDELPGGLDLARGP